MPSACDCKDCSAGLCEHCRLPGPTFHQANTPSMRGDTMPALCEACIRCPWSRCTVRGPCLQCGGPRWQPPPYHDEGELCGNCTRGTGMSEGYRPEY
jgi:hypothetical protein